MRVLLMILAMLLVGVPAAADPRGSTDAAVVELGAAGRALSAAAAAQQALAARYQRELGAIDHLKKQRGSWRRDRQLRDSLAASLETAKQLESASLALQRASARQKQAQQRTLAAIRDELTVASDPARVAELSRQRDRLAPTARAPKKIVLPELAIDPLADPEELEQQAAAIRQSELALATQIASLDDRSTRLVRASELRRQHARAETLSDREEGQSRRGTFRAGRTLEAGPLPDASGDDSAGGSGSGSGSGPPPGGENNPPELPGSGTNTASASLAEITTLAESSTVLGDVIDAAALEALRKAQASSDPAVRAAAARRARAAAAAKLEALRKQRARIEARARELRTSGK